MRPLWLRLLIAVVFFVVCAVILVPAWWIVLIYFALQVGGATLGGLGEAAHGPTADWFNPVAYTSVGVIILLILFMTWKVFHQPDRVLRRLHGFRRTGHSRRS